MRLDRAPKNLTAMVLGTPDFDSIMPVLHAFQNKLDLTAFEEIEKLREAHDRAIDRVRVYLAEAVRRKHQNKVGPDEIS